MTAAARNGGENSKAAGSTRIRHNLSPPRPSSCHDRRLDPAAGGAMNRITSLQPARLAGRYHVWGSVLIVLIICWVVAQQVGDRRNFANSELYRDVMERWGAPIAQPMPSVRMVPSGAVFTRL